jgi:hypothetical protein
VGITHGTSRHVVLAGNAGDGKSFAALAAGVKNFRVTLDASQGETSVVGDPIDRLAARLSSDLKAGARVLLAINRGQFERLEAFTKVGGDGPLREFVQGIRDQASLRATWSDQQRECAFVDLGLLDTAHPDLLTKMVEKIARVSTTPAMSVHAKAAFVAAQESLRSDAVKRFILRVLGIAHARGHHTTLRQLWSFLAFLSTGAREASSGTVPSLADAVGARLFSNAAEGPLFDVAREVVDPAVIPQPQFAREALLGRFASRVRKNLSGLHQLPEGECDRDAELLQRIAFVHGDPACEPMSDQASAFRKIVDHLAPPQQQGWIRDDALSERLLKGVYRVLELWQWGSSFPVWETLCFDSARLADAASVATEELDVGLLRLALPRPSPYAQVALREMWIPPFLWLGFASSTPSPAGALRLTPRMVEALMYQTAERLTRSELLTLRRWLVQCPPDSRRGAALRIGRRGQDGAAIKFVHDPLDSRDRFEREDA